MEPYAYQYSDNEEDASSSDLEVKLDSDNEEDASSSDLQVKLEIAAGREQRRKRRYIILAILALCVVGGAVGGGIAASSSKKDETKSVTATAGVSSGGSIDSLSPVSTSTSAPINDPGPAAAPAPTVPNADELKDAIMTVAREGGAEFDNPDSYQSKALAYVRGQSLPAPKIPLSMEQQAIQLYALACIYYNTYSVSSDWTIQLWGQEIAIPGWYTARGWLGDANEVCNDWWGITCNNDGQVEKIELNENGLTGYMPPETAILHDSLYYLDLFDNNIHNKGDLGNSFLGELTNLRFLYYKNTYFENDGIPSAIAKLTKLEEYDCSYTLYSGPLQGTIFAPLTNLVYLTLTGNTYSSALPEELITLPQLEFLYAGFSLLQGDFEFVHRMPKIIELWLDDNPSMKGTIPTTMGLASTLVSFSATNCELFGPLPTEFGNMLELEKLWLNDNHLTGDIPTELGNLYNLKLLSLQKNDLLGQIPDGVCFRRDWGKLEELKADCDDDGVTPEVACSCCTCCGEGCID
jgi:hypothetical protein